jgi:hypothetical protein
MSEQFSKTVCDEIDFYVYRLIDPRNGETFYVGKGQGNRLFGHAAGKPSPTVAADQTDSCIPDETSEKIARINEIKQAGLNVSHVIHRHSLCSDTAFEVEAALIDAYPGLSNAQGGHHSADRGPMHSQQIIDKYDLPKIEKPPEHKLVLININRYAGGSIEEIYEQTRLAWRIDRNNAARADYVLSVVRGVVVGAFVATDWLPATRENFPQLTTDIPKRSGFNGRPAPKEIWDLYVGDRGKRIAIKDMKHVQFPIRYFNPSQ